MFDYIINLRMDSKIASASALLTSPALSADSAEAIDRAFSKDSRALELSVRIPCIRSPDFTRQEPFSDQREGRFCTFNAFRSIR